MRADFEQAINNLVAASGGRIWIVSGDRDTATQTRLWNEAVAKYGPEEARNWVAPPGNSNHEKGIAVDLGGDLDLAAQLAPRFGLHFPMSWEPWHIEPLGSREQASTDAYTTGPAGASLSSPPTSYGDILLSMIGGPNYSDIFQPPKELIPRTSITKPTLSDSRRNSPVFTSARGGPDGIDNFMRALRSVESSHNYRAVGIPTPWGRATGAYQFLDSTWGNYAGYARAMDAPPEVQDQRARELMQEYYNKYGDWDSVAAAWFSGPGGNWQSAEVQEYIGKVRSNL